MSNIILHQFGNVAVGLNKKTGFINITALTKAYNAKTGKQKKTAHWFETERAKEYISFVSAVTNIHVNDLIITSTGRYEEGGTWVHPDLVDAFYQWLHSSTNNKKSDHLYIIGDLSHKVCKIGVSVNVEKRLKTIQVGYPWNLEILHCMMIVNAIKVEQQLHQRFADFRLNGEWFDSEIINLIDWDEILKSNTSV